MSILDTAKGIYDLAKKGATVELQEELVKLREEAVSLQEDNLALRERINELEREVHLQEAMEFDGRVYWLKESGKDERKGPYCQRCFDVDGTLVRLQSEHYRFDGANYYSWNCRACDKAYDADRP